MSPLLSQLTYYIAIFGGLIAAMFLGSSVGSEAYGTVILCFMIVAGIAWVVLAGEGWWLPMTFGLGIGGFFYVPFKLYPHELALAVCGVALLPRIPFKISGLRKERPPLPIVFYLVFAYLLVHLSTDVVTYWETDGLGNIGRAYMNALWPMIFGLGYYYYGSTKLLRPALRLMYFALLIRMGFGFTNYFFDVNYIVPGLNYTIDQQDLRASGFSLVFLAGVMLLSTPSPIAKVWHFLMLLLGGYACLVGGSRSLFAGVVICSFVMLFVFRRWVPLLVASALAGILVALLNASPTLMEDLPYRFQRTLSALIVGGTVELEVQQDLKGSDQFRSVISDEGYRRWTASPKNFVLGTGIRPFDESSTLMAQRFEVDAFTLLIQSSADVGAYETSLWTLLAITGLTGFLLFAWLQATLARDVIASIRVNHLRGGELAICAWAAVFLTGWFLTFFIYGGFPSFEIFLGLIAKAVVEDRREEAELILAERNEKKPQRPLLPAPERRPELRTA